MSFDKTVSTLVTRIKNKIQLMEKISHLFNKQHYSFKNIVKLVYEYQKSITIKCYICNKFMLYSTDKYYTKCDTCVKEFPKDTIPKKIKVQRKHIINKFKPLSNMNHSVQIICQNESLYYDVLKEIYDEEDDEDNDFLPSNVNFRIFHDILTSNLQDLNSYNKIQCTDSDSSD